MRGERTTETKPLASKLRNAQSEFVVVRGGGGKTLQYRWLTICVHGFLSISPRNGTIISARFQKQISTADVHWICHRTWLPENLTRKRRKRPDRDGLISSTRVSSFRPTRSEKRKSCFRYRIWPAGARTQLSRPCGEKLSRTSGRRQCLTNNHRITCPGRMYVWTVLGGGGQEMWALNENACLRRPYYNVQHRWDVSCYPEDEKPSFSYGLQYCFPGGFTKVRGGFSKYLEFTSVFYCCIRESRTFRTAAHKSYCHILFWQKILQSTSDKNIL